MLLSFVSVSYGANYKLKDVSKQWSYKNNLVSAFSNLYNDIPMGEDHEELINIYSLKSGVKSKGRLEVFETAGDCGWSTFIITDLEQIRRNKDGSIVTYYDGRINKYYSDSPRVYYIESYSTWFEGNCGTRPYQSSLVRSERFLPDNIESIEKFIKKTFIDDRGEVYKSFKPFCEQFSSENENCIKIEDLGDLGA